MDEILENKHLNQSQPIGAYQDVLVHSIDCIECKQINIIRIVSNRNDGANPRELQTSLTD